MFGHKKITPQPVSKLVSEGEVAHVFDQTNGVLREHDLYESRLRGEPTLIDYDSAEQKGRLFDAGAVGGMLGKT